MVDKHLIARKITRIDDNLKEVKKFSSLSQDNFLNDKTAQGAILFYLTQAIQLCVDIAFHIVSDEGWELPGSQTEAFGELRKKGVIDEELMTTFIKIIGFRNMVIHDYEKLDMGRVFAIYQHHLNDLYRYCSELAEKYSL
jgi:uncharacterized protein YutE (UPF0331/DUF86 family)